MGSLQRSVYLRLCLPIFFTAFLFFVDVFTQHSSPCLEEATRITFNYSSRFEEKNLSDSTTRKFEAVFQNDSAIGSSSSCRMGPDPYAHGQTTYMTGLLIGSLFGGALSDRYGKKFLLVCCSAVHAVVALMTAFLPHASFYLTARCVTGAACCVIHMCTFSLGVEWSPTQHRIWPPTIFSVIFSVGMMGLAGVAYITQGWMQFHLALAIPQILCLPLYLSIPESPQWLLLNKRMEVLENYRKRSPEDKHCLDLLLETVGTDVQKCNPEKSNTEKESDFIHFRSPTIILRLIIMSYIGLASALTYFGICFNVGSFGVDIYLAQFFSGLSESPSLLLPFLLARCGRRPFTMASLFMSGTACLMSLLVSKFYDCPGLVMTLALMGKLCMQSTTCVSLLYGIELFPTVIRQKCVSLVNLSYRIGCIVNAVVAPKGGIPLVAMICYSSGPILGAWLCLLLPETSGIPLPDTVQDCEDQPRLRLDNLFHCCHHRPSPDPTQEKQAAFLSEKELEAQKGHGLIIA